jgi:hypothetical protein
MKRILIAPMLLIFASHQATAQDDSSKRAYLGVQLRGGALVGTVNDNGPAQAAGIEADDLIVRFDGKEIKSSDELSQTIAATPIGKQVTVTVIRRGKEGTTTAKLGQRLVLNGTALDEFRQKLGGMLQELGSLGASRGVWNQAELQKFSELFDQFEELKKTVPPEDSVVQNLWAQLEREFRIYKPFADNIRRQREATEAQRGQSNELERKTEDELTPLYVDYMTLQVCAERFQQFDNTRSGLREFLKNKEIAVPHELTDKLWNSIAEKFQKIEAGLERTGNPRLYAECQQASKEVTALITAARAEPALGPPLRKKE